MKEAKRKEFTGFDLEGISLDVLKNSFFFISDNLKLKRVSNSQIASDDKSKGAVVSRKVREEILISKDTKGKLLEAHNIFERNTGRITGKELSVQFDSDRNCFLVFAIYNNKSNAFKLQKKSVGTKVNITESKGILYNGEIYEATTYFKGAYENIKEGFLADLDSITLEFQLRETEETVTKEAQGAW